MARFGSKESAMETYELLGKTLGHSFSKPIHESLGAYQYNLLELATEEDVKLYLNKRELNGCNVTIPYKQTVMPHCDILDEQAKRIGAVNTIVNRNGVLYGYNTDYDGFAYMLDRKNIRLKNKKVLLLGSGATSKTATIVAEDKGASEIVVASRNPKNQQISYKSAMQRGDFDVIINVSPAGMYPNNGETLLDLTCFKNLEAVVDVVYNPLQTKLLYDAQTLNITNTNGLSMLVEQAVAAAKLFTDLPFDHSTTEKALQKIQKEMYNIILVGMPSSGKSKLGKVLARKLKKEFSDMDHVLEKREGRTIPEIFAQDGEKYFRSLETEVLAEETRQHGRVLATGGGVITQEDNFPLLHQNGIIIFLNRPIHHLQIGGKRPLSHSSNAVQKMYKQRLPLYRKAADIEVTNSAPFMQTVQKLLEEINAFFNH